MYNENEPLINQLSFVHLEKACDLSKLLFNKKELKKLNEKSLTYRGKN